MQALKHISNRAIEIHLFSVICAYRVSFNFFPIAFQSSRCVRFLCVCVCVPFCIFRAMKYSTFVIFVIVGDLYAIVCKIYIDVYVNYIYNVQRKKNEDLI